MKKNKAPSNSKRPQPTKKARQIELPPDSRVCRKFSDTELQKSIHRIKSDTDLADSREIHAPDDFAYRKTIATGMLKSRKFSIDTINRRTRVPRDTLLDIKDSLGLK